MRNKFKDYSEEAETLYIKIAESRGLEFHKERNEYNEQFIVILKQPKLRFKLTLGLTGSDEANIGLGEFWSYIFPFPDKVEYISSTIIGLMDGTYRLVEYSQFKKVVKRRLLNDKNEIIYTEVVALKLPLFGEKITKTISNKEESYT